MGKPFPFKPSPTAWQRRRFALIEQLPGQYWLTAEAIAGQPTSPHPATCKACQFEDSAERGLAFGD